MTFYNWLQNDIGLCPFPASTCRMQQKPLRVSLPLRCQWRRRHPPTLSLRSLCRRLMSPHPAERRLERRLPNLPSLPNPQRYPRPPNLRRCRRSRKEERRKRRRQKSRRRLRSPPASQLSSPTQRTYWVKWTSPKRWRWAVGNVSIK